MKNGASTCQIDNAEDKNLFQKRGDEVEVHPSSKNSDHEILPQKQGFEKMF